MGEVLYSQGSLELVAPDGGTHSIDLHWRINNSEVLAQLFDFEELYTRSRDLPKLSSHSKAVSSIDAMLIACMHCSVHEQSPYYVDGQKYQSGDRSIWLYDIALIQQGYSNSEWEEFSVLVRQKGLPRSSLKALQHSKAMFGVSAPLYVEKSLSNCANSAVDRYLAVGATTRDWMNFCAQSGFTRRALHVKDCLLYTSPSPRDS